MRRRDKPGRKVAKTQRRKALGRRNAPKAVHRRSSLVAAKETNVARLTRERDEALEQQTATSEVPKSYFEFERRTGAGLWAVLESATRICEAKFGTLHLQDGDILRLPA